MEKTVQRTIRVPYPLSEAVDMRCRKEGITKNEFTVRALTIAVRDGDAYRNGYDEGLSAAVGAIADLMEEPHGGA